MYGSAGIIASLTVGNIPLSRKYYLLGAAAEKRKSAWAAG
jgi:hypothetical protein